jgi:thiol:disulfide interchange protein DsbD
MDRQTNIGAVVTRILGATILFAVLTTAFAISEDDLLPPEEAFALSAVAEGSDAVGLHWDIADGYYLYQHRMGVSSESEGVTLGDAQLPPGKEKVDEFFGKVVTYRQAVDASVPLTRTRTDQQTIEIEVTSQGCADLGICYPPLTQVVQVALPAKEVAPLLAGSSGGLTEKLDNLLGINGKPAGALGEGLLPPDVAFVPMIDANDGSNLEIRWQIADGYYLYRDKIGIELIDPPEVTLGSVRTPEGTVLEDEFFGQTQVYFGEAKAIAELDRPAGEPMEALIRLQYQGCAEMGICYPPMETELPVLLAAFPSAAAAERATTVDEGNLIAMAEQDRLALSLAQQSMLLTVASFFGFGLLLAFTPCVLPMIPILSGIIVGQREKLTVSRGFVLSLVYVLAMALTYTVAGVLAGLFGSNLQILFQQTWIIVAFSLIFVLLSLSMFGFYELQLPSRWQTRLTEFSNHQSGGNYAGVATMGFLSALIVGPCVAAPLAGALIYIGQSGDAVLGGAALFAMAMGMGAPLLVIGASAGKLIPKAGPWMETIKAVFGVLLLAVAVYLLERVVTPSVAMALWGVLAIVSAVYLGALDSVPQGWHRLWKGMGIVLLVYGSLLLVGAASGGSDTLQPLRGLSIAGKAHQEALAFKRIKSSDDFDRELIAASASGKTVMLDFYADWCVSCKEMERYTFSDSTVQSALLGTVLLQADVTAYDAEDQALLERFKLIGPPAILFFGADAQERTAFRTFGYIAAEEFAPMVAQAVH